MTKLAIGYLGFVIVMSLLTFCAYGYDKYQAQKQGRRTPERVLHGLSLLGGWPGAWMGMRYFRHKTQKTSFQIVFWAIGCLQLIFVAVATYLWLAS